METIKALFKNPRTYIIGLALTFAGDKVLEYVQKGANADLNALIDERIELAFQEKLKQSGVITTLLNAPEVTHFTDSAGVRIAKNVKKEIGSLKDLAKEIGIRDEDLEPLLVQLLTSYKEGTIITKEQLETEVNEVIIKLAKRRRSPEASY